MRFSQRVRVWTIVCLMPLMSWTAMAATPAAGPLRVLPANPRYFTDGKQQFKAPFEGDAVLYLKSQ